MILSFLLLVNGLILNTIVIIVIIIISNTAALFSPSTAPHSTPGAHACPAPQHFPGGSREIRRREEQMPSDSVLAAPKLERRGGHEKHLSINLAATSLCLGQVAFAWFTAGCIRSGEDIAFTQDDISRSLHKLTGQNMFMIFCVWYRKWLYVCCHCFYLVFIFCTYGWFFSLLYFFTWIKYKSANPSGWFRW